MHPHPLAGRVLPAEAHLGISETCFSDCSALFRVTFAREGASGHWRAPFSVGPETGSMAYVLTDGARTAGELVWFWGSNR